MDHEHLEHLDSENTDAIETELDKESSAETNSKVEKIDEFKLNNFSIWRGACNSEQSSYNNVVCDPVLDDIELGSCKSKSNINEDNLTESEHAASGRVGDPAQDQYIDLES